MDVGEWSTWIPKGQRLGLPYLEKTLVFWTHKAALPGLVQYWILYFFVIYKIHLCIVWLVLPTANSFPTTEVPLGASQYINHFLFCLFQFDVLQSATFICTAMHISKQYKLWVGKFFSLIFNLISDWSLAGSFANQYLLILTWKSLYIFFQFLVSTRQDLLLTLFSDAILGGALRLIQGTRDLTWGGHLQENKILTKLSLIPVL